MKKSYSLIELILVIFLISILYYSISLNNHNNKLDELTNRIVLYLKQARYQALIDNKKEKNQELWHKKRWTLKFFNCKKSVGGIYYVIYSDSNMTGHPNLDESLKDPLTKKRIYSSNSCETNEKTSKYVLLTKEFNIKDVFISCNNTSSIGQISFGSEGKVYSKLSSKENESDEYEIKERCKIEIRTKENERREIIIEGRSGYVYKEERP
ncbi:type II secretion system protein [Halarcobacter sp.]|uniref:pilus assembly FimT family protein n=1 Tax=Halarcobacter sp. TaxID=2321133 RepID=UPI0029F51FC8|nr:type II secretion system protein [Halarcobacter sp.]